MASGCEDQVKGYERPSFIQMDEPDHGERRKAVSPVVAPGNLARMEGMIRERTNMVLDGLPRGETFDWVKHVSIELTSRMLATLFDWPLEDRHRLMYLVRRHRLPRRYARMRRSIPRRSATPNCRRWRRR